MTSRTFRNKMDQLVQTNDPELSRALKWIDMEAQKRDISFYDMAFTFIMQHATKSSAKEWLLS